MCKIQCSVSKSHRLFSIRSILCLPAVLSGLFCILFLSSCVSATSPRAVGTDLLMHPRVIWTENPQNQAVVCWDTANEGRNHRFYYDTESRNAIAVDYKEVKNATVSGRYFMNPVKREVGTAYPVGPDLYYHHAKLSGLEPDTVYYFVMASGDAVSREFHFRTASAGDEDLRIIFGGDSRTGVEDRRRINGLIAKMAEEDDSILAFAHGGDYVGNGMNLKQWKSWMKDHELTITSAGKILPLIPARGNHEAKGPIYDQVLAFPGGEGTNYFASMLSPEVLFVTLNNCIEAGGEQKKFLETALSEAKDIRWRVAQYHIPVYPAVKRQRMDKGFEDWVPLFEKYDLALACEADGHCIKRTVPIRNGKRDPTGVVYIGEGGLGVGQRTPDTERWYIQHPGMVSQGHHFQLLSFTKTDLTIEVVRDNGKVIDKYKISARVLDDTGGSQAK